MLRHSDNVHVVTRVEKNLYRLPLLSLFARPKFILKCRFGLFFTIILKPQQIVGIFCKSQVMF